MAERTVTIVNARGLHARSAAKLVAAAKNFDCQIALHLGDKQASCDSMMSLMMLAAGLGSQLQVCATGTDEQCALDTICALIDAGFEEQE
ncbi:MAG TPA: HPr family phosphocarrier protein [Cellvibrionaceae bacterium]